MKIGKVQKRIISYMMADITDAVASGETIDGEAPTTSALTKIAYKYAPYFIEECKGMPEPEMKNLDGVPIRTADSDWIMENIDFTSIMEVLNQAFVVNKLLPAEKKTSNRQSSSRSKKKKTADVSDASKN